MHRRPLHHDTRALFYQMGKQLVFIVAAVLLVKFFVLDVVTMRGDQMAPPIRNGDRLLLLRLPYFPLVHAFPGLGRHQPVVFAMPFEKTLGC
nr:S24/S26 family peptidase [Chitinispirillaceae bacterium]